MRTIHSTAVTEKLQEFLLFVTAHGVVIVVIVQVVVDSGATVVVKI